MIIFCDGVFDLFHEGHVNHFKKIKDMFPNCFLFVGVLNDKISTIYKRIPIFSEDKRISFVDSCKYVDKTTLDYPVIMTEEFITKHNIDLVVHAFSNVADYEKQFKYFEVPIRLNKMKVLDYNKGVSTSSIIKDIKSFNIKCETGENKNGWDKIWELKGKEYSNNLCTSSSLGGVVDAWIRGGTERATVVAKYGEIEIWDTSDVLSLRHVFALKSTFNEDISKWDVSSVTDMFSSTPLSFFLSVLVFINIF